ncbi:MAG: YEATS-associated helix-containing protein [Alphaproteobacteria bacterium]
MLAFLYLMLVLATGGLLGGLARHLTVSETRTSPVPSESTEGPANATPQSGSVVANIRNAKVQAPLLRDLLLGMVAAFVVPVFLQLATVGSTGSVIQKFLDGMTGNGGTGPSSDALNSLTIILGLSVIAGLSARPFLRNISDQILNSAQSAEKRAAEATAAANTAKTEAASATDLAISVEQMATNNDDAIDELKNPEDEEEDQTAPSDEDADAPEADAPRVPAAAFRPRSAISNERRNPQIDAIDRRVLQALAGKPNVRRSIKGIREDIVGADGTQLTFRETRNRLNRMHADGLVRRLEPRTNSNYPRWKLSAAGWTASTRAD